MEGRREKQNERMVDVVLISWRGSKRRGTVDTSKKLAGYQSK